MPPDGVAVEEPSFAPGADSFTQMVETEGPVPEGTFTLAVPEQPSVFVNVTE